MALETEEYLIWRSCSNLPNLKVSQTGQVYSERSKRILKGHIVGPKGKEYLAIGVRVKGKNKSFKIHRLVAEAFLHNIDRKPFVNHKDGNKLNNHIDNLEWATASENMFHAVNTGLNPKRGQYNQNARFTNEQIPEVINLYKSGISQYVLAKKYNVNQSTISDIVNNKTYSRL